MTHNLDADDSVAGVSPVSKNSRASGGTKRGRPCDQCRKRKSKCVTEDGSSVCVLCRFHSQECLYLEAPQPRKRNATASNIASVHPQTSLKRCRTLHLIPGTGVEEYDALPGTSLLKRTLGLQNKNHSIWIGPNDILDAYGSCPFNSDSHDEDNVPRDHVRFVHPSQAFRIVPDNDTYGYEQDLFDIDEIQATAREHGSELIHLYFRVVHPSFPVLHKDVFLEKYARSHREFSPPLLAAVYLLATAYWTYDETLAKSRMIDSEKLQALAFSSLQNAMRRPKLSTIQAGLLLSQWQKAFMGVSNENRDRLTVQLVNIGHVLGLHLDCSAWDIPEWEVGLRKRIGWALYMQDKWTALLESRPPLLSLDDWDVQDLSEEDFPETVEDDKEGSGEVDRGRLVYTHMADLAVILAEILRVVFSARSRRILDAAFDRLGTLLEWIKPLQIRLYDWFLTLPESLKMDTVASMKLSSVGYLRLAYLTVEVCIHKELLRTLQAVAGINPEVAHLCRNAASERFNNAIDFIQRLQAQHLCAFWYFPSAKCCALIHTLGRVLEQTALTNENSSMYAQKLKELRWALKVNSEAGASFMKQALDLINQTARVVHHSGNVKLDSTSPASTGHLMVTRAPTPPVYDHTNQHWGVQSMAPAQLLPDSGHTNAAYNGYNDIYVDPAVYTNPGPILETYPHGFANGWLPELT